MCDMVWCVMWCVMCDVVWYVMWCSAVFPLLCFFVVVGMVVGERAEGTCHSKGGYLPSSSLSFPPPHTHTQADYYVLDEAFIPSLVSKKGEIQSARQKASSVLGWDVPFSSLKFSVALGSCKYGEVFRGMMDKQEVAVKTLKPDGGEVARESFDRELNLL